MLCVERMRVGRLPTICEYEPRCPNIVVNLYNQEVLSQDVPDNASRQPLRGAKPTQTTANARDFDKSQKQPNGLSSTKVRCVKDIVEQNYGESPKIISSSDSQSDIRNKTISPSWGSCRTLTYKTNEKKDNQSDIRNTKINPNSSILHRIPYSAMQETNNRDVPKPCIRNKTIKPSLAIPRSLSGSSAAEPWRAVVMVNGSDQVRVWTRDCENLIVEAVTKDNSQSGSKSQEIEQTTERQRCKLVSQDSIDTEKISIFEDYQAQKSVQHLIKIPEQISLNSLIATLSPEGQLIIKEIRQQKPSRSNTVVIPIEKM